MSFNEFLNKFERVENLVSKNNLFSDTKLELLKKEHNIKSQKELSDDYDDIVQENRLLRIGILGLVKAGKSSFLNTLLFGGDDILPKAATPMTAALSIIEYGEKNGFSVDFYSEADLEQINSNAKHYESMLKESIEKKIATFKENARKKGESPKAEDLEKAESSAKRELKRGNQRLWACYEQNELIKKSKISLAELETHKDFSGDLEAIRAKLSDYVGSEGKFMPFTKSITLRLDNEFLKDVQIIDTPGLNDPVPSRSARTLEFLDKCDAALVLSRAGHFLSDNDAELLGRLANLGSTARIFFVASRADEALSGDEYKGEFNKAFDRLETQLSTRLAEILSNGFTGDKWEQRIDSKIILSSSVRCVDMGMLQEQFGDDFTGANQRANLTKLANMERLESIFAELKKQREAILAQRRDTHLKAITKNLQNYTNSLIERIQEQVKNLNQKDIESIKKEVEILAKAKEKGEFVLNKKWEKESLDFTIKLRTFLLVTKDKFFAELKKSSDSAKTQGTDKWETGWWLWKEKHTSQYNIIDATAVRGGILKTCRNLEELLTRESGYKIKEWGMNMMPNDLLSALRGKVNDEFLDDIAIEKAIKNAIAMLNYPPIQYTTQIPDEIKGANGKFERYEADKFIENVAKFCVDFEDKVAVDINNFIDTLGRTLNEAKLGKIVFGELDNELKRLQNDLENKALRLAEYERLQTNLKEAMK